MSAVVSPFPANRRSKWSLCACWCLRWRRPDTDRSQGQRRPSQPPVHSIPTGKRRTAVIARSNSHRR